MIPRFIPPLPKVDAPAPEWSWARWPAAGEGRPPLRLDIEDEFSWGRVIKSYHLYHGTSPVPGRDVPHMLEGRMPDLTPGVVDSQPNEITHHGTGVKKKP